LKNRWHSGNIYGNLQGVISMVDESIVNVVRNYLKKLPSQGIPVRLGVIIGSHVKGNVDVWSDIDLVVVSPLFDGDYSRELVNRLWRIAARTDNRIEPIPCGELQWQEDSAIPILEVARREGVEIAL